MLTNNDLRPGETIQAYRISDPPLIYHPHDGTQRIQRLINGNCTTVDPERRQWRWINFIAFWIADSLNIVSISKMVPEKSPMEANTNIEHMDDFLLNDRRWSFLVAVLDLCLGWILRGRRFRVPDWTNWRCLSHFFSRHSPSFIRNMGFFMACPQPRGDGYYLVRCAKLYWGYVSFRSGERMHTYTLLGQCVTLMIEAIWPSYRNLHNGLSASAGIDTKNFVSFFLFWLLSLPALWFPVHKVRHLFTAKAIYSPIAAIAFFAWAISRAHGLGPIIHQSNTVHGSDLSWAMVKGIMSCIGNFAALIMNNPDFSRFAKTPKDAFWSQLLTIPVGFGVTSFIGIIVSSSSSVIFNDGYTWNPLDLLGKFLDGASSGQRFGIFIIATGFALAQLGTNISANSISAGTDLTALLPRYMSIRRGSYICAAVGLAMCPVRLTTYLFLTPSNNHDQKLTKSTVEPSVNLKQLHNLPLSLLSLPLRHRRCHDL